MKNKLYIVCMIIMAMNSYSLLNASMNTKDKIEETRNNWVKKCQEHEQTCSDCLQNKEIWRKERLMMTCIKESVVDDRYRAEMVKLALDAQDLTHLEKLNYVTADGDFRKRKEIIKDMIKQGAHPDTIIYHTDNTTPMKEAVLFKDNDFKQFLIQHGAQLPQ